MEFERDGMRPQLAGEVLWKYELVSHLTHIIAKKPRIGNDLVVATGLVNFFTKKKQEWQPAKNRLVRQRGGRPHHLETLGT